ncbi:hypothetical protein Tco_1057182 [Tanacetum coccineum]|uniref:Uncharacterized protein n=1 Tax=Tanacetum coccineum TaxID=301880 RepID=A0ABQ5H5B6_9ASTR
MMASKSYEKHLAHKALYDALIQSLFVDEDDMDQAATAMDQSSQLKIKHDDQDEDLTARSDQEEPDEEHVHDMSLDVEENFVDKMGNADEQPNVVDDQLEKTWFNDLVSAEKDPLTFDELMATPIEFSKFAKNRLKLDKIINVDLVNKLHDYGYLEEIVVRRDDRQKYKFKEGDFINLHLNDIEDMLLLVVQHKLFHLYGDFIGDLAVALLRPQKDFPKISAKEPYTPLFDPQGVVYEDLSYQKRLMRADELYKFSDKTLKSVRDTLHHRILNFQLGYNRDMPRRNWSATDQRRSCIMVDLIDKQLLERRVIRNLERLVGARELEMDYRLMQRTVFFHTRSSFRSGPIL